jgi:hypothetical protein
LRISIENLDEHSCFLRAAALRALGDELKYSEPVWTVAFSAHAYQYREFGSRAVPRGRCGTVPQVTHVA